MPTITLQPDGTDGVDASIAALAATTNYGTDVMYIGEGNNAVDNVQRALMKWDLTDIPISSKVLTATLSLYIYADYASSAADLKVYHVLRNWVEAQATWNIYSTGNNWGTAGCSNTTTDRENTVIGTGSWGAAEAQYTEIQITLTPSEVEKYVGGEMNILIKTDAESNDMYAVCSSDFATADYRPKLVINYKAAAGGLMWFM